MNVTFGTNHALRHVDGALGAQHRAAGRAFVIAAGAEGQIKAEVNAIRVGKLDLGVISDRTENANVGDDPLAGSDDRDQLLAGKLTLLIQIFHLGQRGTRPEECFEICLAHMHVPGRNIHHQRMRWPTRQAGFNGRPF